MCRRWVRTTKLLFMTVHIQAACFSWLGPASSVHAWIHLCMGYFFAEVGTGSKCRKTCFLCACILTPDIWQVSAVVQKTKMTAQGLHGSGIDASSTHPVFILEREISTKHMTEVCQRQELKNLGILVKLSNWIQQNSQPQCINKYSLRVVVWCFPVPMPRKVWPDCYKHAMTSSCGWGLICLRWLWQVL